MGNSPDYPKLRWPLEIRVEKIQGQEVLLIRCPLGISNDPLALVPAVGPLIDSFDGKTSVEDIHKKFQGYGVQRELIQELIALLDKSLFLHNDRFTAAEKQVRATFANSPLRPAFLAGLSYPEAAGDLTKQIDGYLAKGTPGSLQKRGDLICLMSPHIDYRRGGDSYGKTYSRLKEKDSDLYILIGTSHQYSDFMFHLTSKDFASPFGVLKADKDFVTKLSSLYGSSRSFADEFLHRREHSLELQVPFLKRVKAQPTIVPILVGSFYHMLVSDKAPQEFDEYEHFAASLAECIKERIASGQKVSFIAGVDMAHIGRAFGDSGSLTPQKMKEIEERDAVYLSAIREQDKRKLFSHIAEDRDARRICGFPTMYTVLDVVDRLGIKYETETFDYSQAVDYDSDCGVTFAGLGMYQSSP